MNPPCEPLMEHIDTLESESISLQRVLTSIPAIAPESGGEGEEKKAEFVRTILRALPCNELIEASAPDERVPGGMRPNLIATFRGSRTGRTVWILSHLDVVPPGALSQWDGNPYQLVVRDGRCYGRGVEDNHQGIVSSLLSVRAILEMRLRPHSNVGLVIVSDEELGSAFGLDHVLKQHPRLFRPGDWIVVPDAGNADGTMMEVAEKSILWLRFLVRGRQCHGSEPNRGVNAHRASANLVVRMEDLHRLYPALDPVFEPPGSTFEPTRKEENVPNINTIPGADVVFFDCRILPEYDLAEVKRAMRRIADGIEHDFGVTVEITFPNDSPAPPATPVDAPVVLGLSRAIREVTGRSARPVGIGGGTVAALFRRAGLAAVCWQTIEDTAHMPNESCVIANMLTDAKVFARLFLMQE
jgi:succinyl-diaminopimelate desuccinylase